MYDSDLLKRSHFTASAEHWYHINVLVQDCSNSIANALELLQSCTKPSIWSVFAENWWEKWPCYNGRIGDKQDRVIKRSICTYLIPCVAYVYPPSTTSSSHYILLPLSPPIWFNTAVSGARSAARAHSSLSCFSWEELQRGVTDSNNPFRYWRNHYHPLLWLVRYK